MKKSKIVLIVGALFMSGSLFSSQVPDWDDYSKFGTKKESRGQVHTYVPNESTMIWKEALVVLVNGNYPDIICYKLTDGTYIKHEKCQESDNQVSYKRKYES